MCEFKFSRYLEDASVRAYAVNGAFRSVRLAEGNGGKRSESRVSRELRAILILDYYKFARWSYEIRSPYYSDIKTWRSSRISKRSSEGTSYLCNAIARDFYGGEGVNDRDGRDIRSSCLSSFHGVCWRSRELRDAIHRGQSGSAVAEDTGVCELWKG